MTRQDGHRLIGQGQAAQDATPSQHASFFQHLSEGYDDVLGRFRSVASLSGQVPRTVSTSVSNRPYNLPVCTSVSDRPTVYWSLEPGKLCTLRYYLVAEDSMIGDDRQ